MGLKIWREILLLSRSAEMVMRIGYSEALKINLITIDCYYGIDICIICKKSMLHFCKFVKAWGDAA